MFSSLFQKKNWESENSQVLIHKGITHEKFLQSLPQAGYGCQIK